MKKSFNRGFTFVEMLMVIAIIGILSSIVMSTIGSGTSKARAAKAVSDAHQVMTSIEYANTDGCSVFAPTAFVAGAAFSCDGKNYLQALPAAPSSIYNFSFYKADGSSDWDGNPGNYLIKVTGFTDGGEFDCSGGSCLCSPVGSCLK